MRFNKEISLLQRDCQKKKKKKEADVRSPKGVLQKRAFFFFLKKIANYYYVEFLSKVKSLQVHRVWRKVDGGEEREAVAHEALGSAHEYLVLLRLRLQREVQELR